MSPPRNQTPNSSNTKHSNRKGNSNRDLVEELRGEGFDIGMSDKEENLLDLESSEINGVCEVTETTEKDSMKEIRTDCEDQMKLMVAEPKVGKPLVEMIRDNRQSKRAITIEFEAPNMVDGEPKVVISYELLQETNCAKGT